MLYIEIIKVMDLDVLPNAQCTQFHGKWAEKDRNFGVTLMIEPVFMRATREGVKIMVGTICVALIIGLPLGYALFSYAKHNGIFGMNIYHVPIVPILIMIFLVGLLQIVLSCILSSNLKKETLVERIRYQG